MLPLLKDLYQRRELLFLLVGRNLKIRYKDSTLGFFWSLLVPVLMILIYSTFAGILKFNLGRPKYLQFLVVGIVVWQFLALCLGDSLSTIVGNANLVKKTAFPRIILPLSMVTANLVNFLLTSVVLVGFLLLSGMHFRHPELLPVVVLTQYALCLGIALIASASNVFFRDTEHVMGIVTLAWFFLTPIFYPVSMQVNALPSHLAWCPFLNPMTGLVWAYRSILMYKGMPDLQPLPEAMALSFLVAWAVLFAGVAVFQKCQARFADEL